MPIVKQVHFQGLESALFVFALMHDLYFKHF